MSKKSLSYAEIVVVVLIVGILAAILLPALAKSRETRQRRACMNNLKQLGLALKMYADENKRRLPPVDDTKNNFTFDANLLYPEYLSDAMFAMCPGDSRWDPDTNFRLISDHAADGASKGEVHPDCLTDDSYIYLGWLVMSDKETESFFAAYDNLSPDDYDANIVVSEGWGNIEGDTIHRLGGQAEWLLIGDITWAGSTVSGSPTIPIMWDRQHTDVTKFSHRVGGYVLYMDGHVKYHRFDDRFPMTETMARLLHERPRERIPDCDE